jgi:hypothetical protein
MAVPAPVQQVMAPAPKHYVVVHPWYHDTARMDREIALAKEIGFTGLRINFYNGELLNSTKTGMSDWGKQWAILTFQKIAAAGLDCHITISADDPAATWDVNQKARADLMVLAMGMIPAGKLSASWTNEPPGWVSRSGTELTKAAQIGTAMYDWLDTPQPDGQSPRAKGVVPYSPTLQGVYSDWVNGAHVLTSDMGTDIQRMLNRMEWLYDPAQTQRVYIRRGGFALNLYVPQYGADPAIPDDEEAGEFAYRKALAAVTMLRKNTSHNIGITEYNVYESVQDDYTWGRQAGSMARRLATVPQLTFYTFYCLTGHDKYELMTKEGVRREARIFAFKVMLSGK